MKGRWTRKELYDLVWSQPMSVLARATGISDVALAKHCKKADIPVPSRGYWARKRAGKSAVQIALPPRFPGKPDRLDAPELHVSFDAGGLRAIHELPIPPDPTFDEEISAVAERARDLVRKIRFTRKFEPTHPLVAKLLADDEERRQDALRWGSSHFVPKYAAGVERRRLLIVNALFVAATQLGCRPSMSTSKYEQIAPGHRLLSIASGRSEIRFSIEPIQSKKPGRECLRLGLGRDPANPSTSWQDDEAGALERRLPDVLVAILVKAEEAYRDGLIQHREWIIEVKARAAEEVKRRQAEAERQAREHEARLQHERIDRLLAEAAALDRANQIRAYVESVLSSASELALPPSDVSHWASWARGEADRIDPRKNGMTTQAIRERLVSVENKNG